MITLSNDDLTEDHRTLLATIARPWLDTWNWPVWGHVLDHFEPNRVDANDLARSLPRVGTDGQVGPSYSFANAARPFLNDGDQVRVTIAASLALPEVKMRVGDPFVEVLRHMIQLHADKPRSAHEVTYAQLRSDELMATMPQLKPDFVNALPDLLAYEPAVGHAGHSIAPDGSWVWYINRSVLQFLDVTTVEEYIAKTCEIVRELARPYTGGLVIPVEGDAAAPVLTPPEPEPEPYIHTDLLADLEDTAAKTTWSLDKLLTLCRELNSNYAAGHPYSCLALIRAIIDHIPPAFGQEKFSGVVSNYRWTRTDKAYAQQLAGVRPVGDDVMHRQIRDRRSLVRMVDLPAPVYLNEVLQELLSLLRKDPGDAAV